MKCEYLTESINEYSEIISEYSFVAKKLYYLIDQKIQELNNLKKYDSDDSDPDWMKNMRTNSSESKNSTLSNQEIRNKQNILSDVRNKLSQLDSVIDHLSDDVY